MKKKHRSIPALAVAIGLSLVAIDGRAQTNAQFDLPAQPLVESLRAVGRRSNINILIDRKLIGQRQARALKAMLSVDEALTQLLEGSGLQHHFLDENTVTIVPAPVGHARPETTGSTRSELEEVTVTGSRLGVDYGDVAPVRVITADEMARAGVTSLGDALRRFPASAGVLDGNIFNGDPYIGHGATGASGANLRGLGVGSTLVLLNGRRVVTFGYAGSGGRSSFVDLNSLPFAAIDRIEILKNGASAIYGSDAIAGVINIILRPEFEGIDASASVGTSGEGDARERRFSAAAGVGSRSADGYNVLVTFDHSDGEGLRFADRERTRSADLRRFALPDLRLETSRNINIEDGEGNFLGTLFPCPAADTRADGRCVFDQSALQPVQPERSDNSVRVAAEIAIGEHAALFTELGYSNNSSKFEFTQSTLPLALPSTAFYGGLLPVTFEFPGSDQLPAAQGTYLAAAFGNRELEVETQNYRGVLGAHASFGDWRVDAAGTWNRGDAMQSYHNLVRASDLAGAVLGLPMPVFTLRPDGGVTAEERERFAPAFDNSSRSTLRSAELSASGPVLGLPAGALKLALGGEFRHEGVDLATAEGFDAAVYSDVALLQDVVDSREVRSGYAELGIPLHRTLSMQLAVRYDEYSKAREATRDPGSSFTTKFGARYQPLHWLTVRAVYEEGFRAPSLFETSLTPLGTAIRVPIFDPVRCPVTLAVGDCVFAAGRIGSNPDLDSERSSSVTAGLLVQPVDGLQLSLDFFRIERTDEIQTPTSAFLFANEAAYPDRVVRGPVDIPGLPGPVVLLDARFLNIGRSEVRGVDFSVNHETYVEKVGMLRVSLDTTYLDEHSQAASSDLPSVSLAGFQNVPRWRGIASAGIARDAWDSTLSIEHTAGYRQAANDAVPCDFTLTAPAACAIGAYTTVHLTGRYHWSKHLTVGFAIRNLLDRSPPFDLTGRGLINGTYHDIRGRYFRLQMSSTF